MRQTLPSEQLERVLNLAGDKIHHLKKTLLTVDGHIRDLKLETIHHELLTLQQDLSLRAAAIERLPVRPGLTRRWPDTCPKWPCPIGTQSSPSYAAHFLFLQTMPEPFVQRCPGPDRTAVRPRSDCLSIHAKSISQVGPRSTQSLTHLPSSTDEPPYAGLSRLLVFRSCTITEGVRSCLDYRFLSMWCVLRGSYPFECLCRTRPYQQPSNRPASACWRKFKPSSRSCRNGKTLRRQSDPIVRNRAWRELPQDRTPMLRNPGPACHRS